MVAFLSVRGWKLKTAITAVTILCWGFGVSIYQSIGDINLEVQGWGTKWDCQRSIPFENQFDTFRDFCPQKVSILFFSTQKVGNFPMCGGCSPFQFCMLMAKMINYKISYSLSKLYCKVLSLHFCYLAFSQFFLPLFPNTIRNPM